jgi:hypothetical protein
LITSRVQTKRRRETHFFPDIAQSCSKEIQGLGFEADVFLIPGGVGVRFQSDRNFSNLNEIAYLPIKELDLSRVSSFDPPKINDFKLEALSLPIGCSIPFREFKCFPLKRFSGANSKASDFESLAILDLEELNLPGAGMEQLSFTHSMPLVKLDLSHNRVLDIRPLSEKPLEILNLQGTQVDNLNPISSCPISVLNLNQTKVENLEPLRGLPLTQVELRKTLIEDLSPLMESPLEKLSLPGSPIRSLVPLTFCPLKFLNIIGLILDDLSPLREMQLETLCISPLNLEEEHFNLLKELNLKHMLGPGDDPNQTAGQFFQKYSPGS